MNTANFKGFTSLITLKLNPVKHLNARNLRYVPQNGVDTITLKTKKIEIPEDFFDFLPWKKGYRSLPQTVTPNEYTPEARRVSEIFDTEHRVKDKIPDGFRMSASHCDNLNAEGRIDFEDEILAPGEIMLVDRTLDKGLNTTIRKFKELLNLHPDCSEYQKAQLLKDFVNGCYKNERNHWTDQFPLDFVKLGQTIKSGAGMCRHRALLAKVLADETGMNVSIVRGCFDLQGLEPHMWNEVTIDGEKYLFDSILNNIAKLGSKAEVLNKYYQRPNCVWKQIYV